MENINDFRKSRLTLLRACFGILVLGALAGIVLAGCDWKEISTSSPSGEAAPSSKDLPFEPTPEGEFVFVAINEPETYDLIEAPAFQPVGTIPAFTYPNIPRNPQVPQPIVPPSYQPPVTIPRPMPNPPSIPWQPPISQPILPHYTYP